MTPESIYLTLTKGNMVTIATGLTDQQKRDIAEWVGGRKLGAAESGDAKKMTNVCASNPPIRDLISKPSWNGWSADLSTTRFQPAKAANLSAAQVSRLRLKWAFGLPGTSGVNSQPTIAGGRLFIQVDTGYVYALDALAQVEAARGHYAQAIRLERRAVEAIPLPQFVTTLGDLEHVTGHERLARRQYALIGVIQRLLAANGVRTDLETALFDVDHGVRLERTLALARLARRERPSIDGDDVLAWALARTGHCGEALRFSKRALRLGTRDAPKDFHRGMIERCLGHDAQARLWFRRALHLNPHFSLLWAPVARRYAS